MEKYKEIEKLVKIKPFLD